MITENQNTVIIIVVMIIIMQLKLFCVLLNSFETPLYSAVDSTNLHQASRGTGGPGLDIDNGCSRSSVL